jgi:hypothetical protein
MVLDTALPISSSEGGAHQAGRFRRAFSGSYPGTSAIKVWLTKPNYRFKTDGHDVLSPQDQQ